MRRIALPLIFISFLIIAVPLSSEEASHLQIVCQEKNCKIEILSSVLVPGAVKPAYSHEVKLQLAQLIDDKGQEVTQAFYEVVREIRWTEVKPGSNDLTGGSVPDPEPVFTVRVQYSPKAHSLKLSKVKNQEALKTRRSKTPVSQRIKVDPKEIESLLTVPLKDLLKQEVKQ